VIAFRIARQFSLADLPSTVISLYLTLFVQPFAGGFKEVECLHCRRLNIFQKVNLKRLRFGKITDPAQLARCYD
jgi:hypothetical protein